MQTSNKELILLVDDDPGNLKKSTDDSGGRISYFCDYIWENGIVTSFKSDTGSDPFGCKYAGNERI